MELSWVAGHWCGTGARSAGDALTLQLRDTGTHSRFIDGVVLEDGFELDEAAAPIIALASYVEHTGDVEFLRDHREALATLRNRIIEHYEPSVGLYSLVAGSAGRVPEAAVPDL